MASIRVPAWIRRLPRACLLREGTVPMRVSTHWVCLSLSCTKALLVWIRQLRRARLEGTVPMRVSVCWVLCPSLSCTRALLGWIRRLPRARLEGTVPMSVSVCWVSCPSLSCTRLDLIRVPLWIRRLPRARLEREGTVPVSVSVRWGRLILSCDCFIACMCLHCWRGAPVVFVFCSIKCEVVSVS